MSEHWYMVIQENGTSWSWCLLRDDGAVVKRSTQNFAQYLEAYEDARSHGCDGVPEFARFTQ